VRAFQLTNSKITGVTGLVGFKALLTALEAGYRVRGSIRREEQAEQIKAIKSVKPYADKLDFVVVSDITADGAFDKALEGVTYVLHIASPLGKKVSSLLLSAQQDLLGSIC
jgi:nucleoside-diphosphate-sugar epimerase